MKSEDSSLFVPKNTLFLPIKSFCFYFCYNEGVRKKTNEGGLRSEKRKTKKDTEAQAEIRDAFQRSVYAEAHVARR